MIDLWTLEIRLYFHTICLIFSFACIAPFCHLHQVESGNKQKMTQPLRKVAGEIWPNICEELSFQRNKHHLLALFFHSIDYRACSSDFCQCLDDKNLRVKNVFTCKIAVQWFIPWQLWHMLLYLVVVQYGTLSGLFALSYSIQLFSDSEGISISI